MKNLSIFLGLIVVVLTGALISTNNKLNNQVELTEYHRDRASEYSRKIFLLEEEYSNNNNNDKLFKTPDAGQTKPTDKVVVEWISDPTEVKKLLSKLSYKDRLFEKGENYLGYAYWDHEDDSGVKKCTIIAPEPAGDFDDYRLSILGHEIYHCYVGIFHN